MHQGHVLSLMQPGRCDLTAHDECKRNGRGHWLLVWVCNARRHSSAGMAQAGKAQCLASNRWAVAWPSASMQLMKGSGSTTSLQSKVLDQLLMAWHEVFDQRL